MSFMALHQTKTSVSVLMDTGSTLPDGSPYGFCSKAVVVPHLQMLMTVRGLSCMEQGIYTNIQQGAYDSFDGLVQDFANVGTKGVEYIEALADADLIADFDPSLIDVEVVLIGYSDTAGRMRVCAFSSRYDFATVEVSSVIEYAPQFLNVADIPQNVRRMKDPVNDLTALAKLNHQHGQAKSFIDEGGVPCRFGGGLTYFEVTKNSVTSKRLRTNFPDFNDFTNSN